MEHTEEDTTTSTSIHFSVGSVDGSAAKPSSAPQQQQQQQQRSQPAKPTLGIAPPPLVAPNNSNRAPALLPPQAPSPPHPHLRKPHHQQQQQHQPPTAFAMSSSLADSSSPIRLHPSRSVSPSDASLLFVQAVSRLDTPHQMALHPSQGQSGSIDFDEDSERGVVDDDEGSAMRSNRVFGQLSSKGAPSSMKQTSAGGGEGKASNPSPAAATAAPSPPQMAALATGTNTTRTSSVNSIRFEEDDEHAGGSSALSRQQQPQRTAAAPTTAPSPKAAPRVEASATAPLIAATKPRHSPPPQAVKQQPMLTTLKQPPPNATFVKHLAGPPLTTVQIGGKTMVLTKLAGPPPPGSAVVMKGSLSNSGGVGGMMNLRELSPEKVRPHTSAGQQPQQPSQEVVGTKSKAAGPLVPSSSTASSPGMRNTSPSQSRAGSSPSPRHDAGLVFVLPTPEHVPSPSSEQQRLQQQQQQQLASRQPQHQRTLSASSPQSSNITLGGGYQTIPSVSLMAIGGGGGTSSAAGTPRGLPAASSQHFRLLSNSMVPEDDPVYCTVSEMTYAASMRGATGTMSVSPAATLGMTGAAASLAGIGAGGGNNAMPSSRWVSAIPKSPAGRRVQSFDYSLDESNALLTLNDMPHDATGGAGVSVSEVTGLAHSAGMKRSNSGALVARPTGVVALTPDQSPSVLSPSSTHHDLLSIMPLPSFPRASIDAAGDAAAATHASNAPASAAAKQPPSKTNVSPTPPKHANGSVSNNPKQSGQGSGGVTMKPAATPSGGVSSSTAAAAAVTASAGASGGSSSLPHALSGSAETAAPSPPPPQTPQPPPPRRQSTAAAFFSSLPGRSLLCRHSSGSVASKTGSDEKDEQHSSLSASQRSHPSTPHSRTSGISRFSSQLVRGARKAIGAGRPAMSVDVKKPRAAASAEEGRSDVAADSLLVDTATTATVHTCAPAVQVDVEVGARSHSSPRPDSLHLSVLAPTALSPGKLMSRRSSASRGQSSSADGSINFHTDDDEQDHHEASHTGTAQGPHMTNPEASVAPPVEEEEEKEAKGLAPTAAPLQGKGRSTNDEDTKGKPSARRRRRHHHHGRHRRGGSSKSPSPIDPLAPPPRTASSGGSSSTSASSSSASSQQTGSQSTSTSLASFQRQKERERRRRRRQHHHKHRRQRKEGEGSDGGVVAGEKKGKSSHHRSRRHRSRKQRSRSVASSVPSASRAAGPRKRTRARQHRGDSAEQAITSHRPFRRSCEGQYGSDNDEVNLRNGNDNAAAHSKPADGASGEVASSAAVLAARRRALLAQSRVHSSVNHFHKAWHSQTVWRHHRWRQEQQASRARQAKLTQLQRERKQRSETTAIAAAVAAAASRSTSLSHIALAPAAGAPAATTQAVLVGPKKSTGRAVSRPATAVVTGSTSAGHARRLEQYEAALTSDIAALDEAMERMRRHGLWVEVSPQAASAAPTASSHGAPPLASSSEQLEEKNDDTTTKAPAIGRPAVAEQDAASPPHQGGRRRRCAPTAAATTGLAAGPLPLTASAASSVVGYSYAGRSQRSARVGGGGLRSGGGRSCTTSYAPTRGDSSPAPRKPPGGTSVSSYTPHVADAPWAPREPQRSSPPSQARDRDVGSSSSNTTTAALQRRYEALLEEAFERHADVKGEDSVISDTTVSPRPAHRAASRNSRGAIRKEGSKLRPSPTLHHEVEEELAGQYAVALRAEYYGATNSRNTTESARHADPLLAHVESLYAQAARPSCAGCRPQSAEEYVTLGLLSMLREASPSQPPSSTATGADPASPAGSARWERPSGTTAKTAATLVQRRIREELYAPPPPPSKQKLRRHQCEGAALPLSTSPVLAQAVASLYASAASEATDTPRQQQQQQQHPFTPSLSVVFDTLRTRLLQAEQRGRRAVRVEETHAAQALHRHYIIETICVLRALRAREQEEEEAAEAAAAAAKEEERLRQQQQERLQKESELLNENGVPHHVARRPVTHEPVSPAVATVHDYFRSSPLATPLGEDGSRGDEEEESRNTTTHTSGMWVVPPTGNSDSVADAETTTATNTDTTTYEERRPSLSDHHDRVHVDSHDESRNDESSGTDGGVDAQQRLRGIRNSSPPPPSFADLHEDDDADTNGRLLRSLSSEGRTSSSGAAFVVHRSLPALSAAPPARYVEQTHSPLSATRREHGWGGFAQSGAAVVAPAKEPSPAMSQMTEARGEHEEQPLRTSDTATPPADNAETMQTASSSHSSFAFAEEEHAVPISTGEAAAAEAVAVPARPTSTASSTQSSTAQHTSETSAPVFAIHDDASRNASVSTSGIAVADATEGGPVAAVDAGQGNGSTFLCAEEATASSVSASLPPREETERPTRQLFTSDSSSGGRSAASDKLVEGREAAHGSSGDGKGDAVKRSGSASSASSSSSLRADSKNSASTTKEDGKDAGARADDEPQKKLSIANSDESGAHPLQQDGESRLVVVESAAETASAESEEVETRRIEEKPRDPASSSTSFQSSPSSTAAPEGAEPGAVVTVVQPEQPLSLPGPPNASSSPTTAPEAGGTSPMLKLSTAASIIVAEGDAADHAVASTFQQEAEEGADDEEVRPLSIDRGDSQQSFAATVVAAAESAADAVVATTPLADAAEGALSNVKGLCERSAAPSSSSSFHPREKHHSGTSSDEAEGAAEAASAPAEHRNRINRSEDEAGSDEAEEDDEVVEVHIKRTIVGAAPSTRVAASLRNKEEDNGDDRQGVLVVSEEQSASSIAMTSEPSCNTNTPTPAAVAGAPLLPATQRASIAVQASISDSEAATASASEDAPAQCLDVGSQTSPLLHSGLQQQQPQPQGSSAAPSQKRVRFSLPLTSVDGERVSDAGDGDHSRRQAAVSRQRNEEALTGSGLDAETPEKRVMPARTAPPLGAAEAVDEGGEVEEEDETVSEKTAIDLLDKLHGLDALLLFKFPEYFTTGTDEDGMPAAVMRRERGGYAPRRPSPQQQEQPQQQSLRTSMDRSAFSSTSPRRTHLSPTTAEATQASSPSRLVATAAEEGEGVPDMTSDMTATDTTAPPPPSPPHDGGDGERDNSPSPASGSADAPFMPSPHAHLAPPQLPAESLAEQMRRKYGLKRRSSAFPQRPSLTTPPLAASAVPYTTSPPLSSSLSARRPVWLAPSSLMLPSPVSSSRHQSLRAVSPHSDASAAAAAASSPSSERARRALAQYVAAAAPRATVAPDVRAAKPKQRQAMSAGVAGEEPGQTSFSEEQQPQREVMRDSALQGDAGSAATEPRAEMPPQAEASAPRASPAEPTASQQPPVRQPPFPKPEQLTAAQKTTMLLAEEETTADTPAILSPPHLMATARESGGSVLPAAAAAASAPHVEQQQSPQQLLPQVLDAHDSSAAAAASTSSPLSVPPASEEQRQQRSSVKREGIVVPHLQSKKEDRGPSYWF